MTRLGLVSPDMVLEDRVLYAGRVSCRFDKRFSDLLEPSAFELHAVRLDEADAQRLLERLQQVPEAVEVLLVNRKVTGTAGHGPGICACAVVELVAVAAGLCKRDVAPWRDLNNIDLLLDRIRPATAAGSMTAPRYNSPTPAVPNSSMEQRLFLLRWAGMRSLARAVSG